MKDGGEWASQAHGPHRHGSQREDDPGKMAPMLTSLKATAEAAALLYCSKSSPDCLGWGGGRVAFWARIMRAIPPTAVTLNAPVLILKHQFSLQTTAEDASWLQILCKFFLHKSLTGAFFISFASFPWDQITATAWLKEDLPERGFCFSAPPPATVLSPLSRSENADEQLVVFILMVTHLASIDWNNLPSAKQGVKSC